MGRLITCIALTHGVMPEFGRSGTCCRCECVSVGAVVCISFCLCVCLLSRAARRWQVHASMVHAPMISSTRRALTLAKWIPSLFHTPHHDVEHIPHYEFKLELYSGK